MRRPVNSPAGSPDGWSLVPVFDTGPLGLAVKVPGRPGRDELHRWLAAMDDAGARVVVPGIADYELRRELILQKLTASILRLDILIERIEYLPIDDPIMRRAAELWAVIREAGRPTAGREALDGDCILAAHAMLAGEPGDTVVVITTNVRHLERFPGIDVRRWQDVDPGTA